MAIAYDATIGNQVESEYIIQHRIPGVSLEGIYHDLEMNEKAHILGQVIDLLAEMENIQFPATGQLAAAGCLPDALIMDRGSTSSNASVAIGSFPTRLVHPPQTGYQPTTLEGAFANQFRFWDAERETPVGEVWVPMFARLSEITTEMKGLGFFEECSVAPNVLHHWDFEARNIMVEGGNGLYKVTGLLDWGSVLSVPLVLARKPPAWLWIPESEMTRGRGWWDEDADEVELGPAELRTLFEHKMEKRVGSKYVEDAFGKGRWIRRVWRFLLHGFFLDEDYERYGRFVEEWNSYRESEKLAA